MKTKLAAIVAAGALIAAACGNDSDDAVAAPPDDDDDAAPEEAAEEPPEDADGVLRVWLNAGDTPDEMRELAIERFNEIHPNVEVRIEEQDWDGLVARLQSVLPTGDSPDIVETGNTQTPEFAQAGAFVDISDEMDRFGGDDLLDSFVEQASVDGGVFALPLLAGVRMVTYRTDLFEEAGLEVPTTFDEFLDAGRTLQDEFGDLPNFSGIYLPGRNWHAQTALIWEAGGEIAELENGEWVGRLSSPESIAGLETAQDIMLNINSTPPDADDSQDFEEFCNGEIGMLLGSPGFKVGQILSECPEEMEGNVGAFALPAADGGVAPVFAGGSHLAISANSDNADLALDFLEIIASEEFQAMYAENGLVPIRKSVADSVEVDDPGAQAQAEAGVNARTVPASPNWGEVEGQEILHDLGTAIARGDDVTEEAERANEAIEAILNQ